VKEHNKSKESVAEVLEDLAPYTSYILELIEQEVKKKEFHSMRYKSEDCYNEVVALKKILNLMRFLLK
jgi:hypothetical protein